MIANAGHIPAWRELGAAVEIVSVHSRSSARARQTAERHQIPHADAPEDRGGTIILGTKAGLRLNPLTLIGRLGSYQADPVPKVPADPAVPFQGHHRAAGQARPEVR